MTRDEIKLNVTKWGAIVGIVGGLWLLVAAAGGAMDKTYVRRDEYREHFIRDSLWKREVDLKLESIDGKLDDVFQCIRRPECK